MGYMAPEQFRNAKSVGFTADLYAVGVVIFRSLTGRLPFEGNTAQETMLAHLTGQPMRLFQKISDIEAALRNP